MKRGSHCTMGLVSSKPRSPSGRVGSKTSPTPTSPIFLISQTHLPPKAQHSPFSVMSLPVSFQPHRWTQHFLNQLRQYRKTSKSIRPCKNTWLLPSSSWPLLQLALWVHGSLRSPAENLLSHFTGTHLISLASGGHVALLFHPAAMNIAGWHTATHSSALSFGAKAAHGWFPQPQLANKPLGEPGEPSRACSGPGSGGRCMYWEACRWLGAAGWRSSHPPASPCLAEAWAKRELSEEEPAALKGSLSLTHPASLSGLFNAFYLPQMFLSGSW